MRSLHCVGVFACAIIVILAQQDASVQADGLRASLGASQQADEPWPEQHKTVSALATNSQVIVTICNYGYLKWLRQWHAFIVQRKLTNYVVVALDPKLHAHLQEVIPGHVVFFEDRSDVKFERLVSGQEVIDTKGKDSTFTRLVTNKPIILERFAAWGYDTFWMDADVFLLQDPFSKLDPTCDWEMQHERKPQITHMNSGVFVWRGEKKDEMISIFRRWHAILVQTKEKYMFDQEALNYLLGKEIEHNKYVSKTPGFPGRATFRLNSQPFTMCVLNSKVYRCGNHLPCTNEMKREIYSKRGGIQPCPLPANWEEQKSQIVLTHMNYMSYDEDKINRAKHLGLWFRGKLPMDGNITDDKFLNRI